MRVIGLLATLLVLLGPVAAAQERTTLEAGDGLAVTADIYRINTDKNANWIVLAHQAGSSRGEYRTIAPRLNKLGYNAIALDQRSGAGFGGVANQTAAAAKRLKKKQTYMPAKPDILAGIAWARQQTSGRVILWGSSYSAAMALLLAGEQPGLVDGVVSHSPGEYLRGRSVGKAAVNIAVPVLITSPANERNKWQRIFDGIREKRKAGYAPASGGRHGSSALIPARNRSAPAYWAVVEKFLQAHFKGAS